MCVCWEKDMDPLACATAGTGRTLRQEGGRRGKNRDLLQQQQTNKQHIWPHKRTN